MRIGIPKEIYTNEARVALTPDVSLQFQKLGYTLAIEAGSGKGSKFSDEQFKANGVEVVNTPEEIWQKSDIIMKVRPPQENEIDLMHEGQVLVSFFYPAQNKVLLERCTKKKISVLALDSVPRISRAQKCDALSSMANVAGYRAVIEAAEHFGRFFTGQITAAGKIPPCKVLVIGAGVAGLAAIGVARSMGAIVRVFDTRPEVKEQAYSMGAEFLEVNIKEDGSGAGGYAKVMSPEFIKAEMDLFRAQAAEVDIIITTALIPGKPAPKLILADMVEKMKPGSVIVDLAAEQGGNCELTEPGIVSVKHGVTIIAYTDLPSRLATQSSQLYATNLRHLFTDLTPGKDGKITINMSDEVIRGATVTHQGAITWPPPAPKISSTPAVKPQAEKTADQASKSDAHCKTKKATFTKYVWILLVVAAVLALGYVAPSKFMAHFTVFVLACFIGYMVVWDVTPALHTPLMSVTNAISSIIIIGAIMQISTGVFIVWLLAAVAAAITFINVTGGFAVTQRMLKMFRK